MSMLAEPRRKQKIINLRAKNNAWSNDTNKFGQKMLEKMGWSSGKGLGVNENGIVEHVVARYKNDEKGLGYEDRNDQWTKHEDDFNALLANLSNDDKVTDTLHSGISLEKKSKTSKARIHYHKFTRGKDLSRYSAKDLANIFGKKSFKKMKVEELVKDDVKITEQIFTEKGNMDDYFKTKMAAFKSKLVQMTGNTNNDEDVSDYTFKGFSNSSEVDVENTTSEIISETFSFYNTQNGGVINQNVELSTFTNVESNEIKKNKKSKKKNKLTSNTIESTNLQTDDNFSENVELITCPVIENIECKKKKKSKKTDKLTSHTQSQIIEIDCIEEVPQEIMVDVIPSKVKKSKKKKHQEFEEEVPILNDKISQKKRNKNSVENIQEHVGCSEDITPKKKKKRKQF